jgi:hypothetical protein
VVDTRIPTGPRRSCPDEHTEDAPGNGNRVWLVHDDWNDSVASALPHVLRSLIVPTVFRFIFRLIRLALLAVLGTAVAAKFLLESNAEPETQEIDLVSIFEGRELVTAADPFYGGKILAMFGAVLLDMRKARPAPTGIRLDLAVALGGVSLVVPEGWRVRFEGKAYLGGWSDNTRTTADEDVPTVVVTGFLLAGGLQASTKSPVEAVV